MVETLTVNIRKGLVFPQHVSHLHFLWSFSLFSVTFFTLHLHFRLSLYFLWNLISSPPVSVFFSLGFWSIALARRQ